MVTPRLTAPQLTVLRALDALPEGEWITAKEGGFNANSAFNLAYRGRYNPSFVRTRWSRGDECHLYALPPEGRDLVARLKAEGAI